MKKLTGILLALILCLSILVSAVADDNASAYKININGVNVVFTDGKTVLEPVENDGVLYVPLEAFLKTLGIDYKVNGNEFTITTAVTKEEPTDTPKPTATPKPKTAVQQLSSAESKFLNMFIKNLELFENPASITIDEVWEIDSGYYADVTSQERGRMSSSLYYIASFGIGEKKFRHEFTVPVRKVSFNYSLLNKALAEKLKSLGYIK